MTLLGLADCHLHFEGSLPWKTLERLARRAGHPFAERSAWEAARERQRDSSGFLALYAELCRLFRSPQDYGEAAREISYGLSADGVAYAEIYVSPEIASRFGLDPQAVLAAVDEGFRQAADSGGARCRILLDAVRQWGPEGADRVLDLYEGNPFPSIVGFGLGGDENAMPAAAFAGAFTRARALGLRTCVHAGEWAGAQSLREALDTLRPDRVDHGIAAVKDPALLARLREEDTVLCVAPSGNLRTGAVARLMDHPLPRLLAAGVRVALSADDPILFSTTTSGEYRLAAESFGFPEETVRKIAGNAWRGAFCPPSQKQDGLKSIAEWSLTA